MTSTSLNDFSVIERENELHMKASMIVKPKCYDFLHKIIKERFLPCHEGDDGSDSEYTITPNQYDLLLSCLIRYIFMHSKFNEYLRNNDSVVRQLGVVEDVYLKENVYIEKSVWKDLFDEDHQCSANMETTRRQEKCILTKPRIPYFLESHIRKFTNEDLSYTMTQFSPCFFDEDSLRCNDGGDKFTNCETATYFTIGHLDVIKGMSDFMAKGYIDILPNYTAKSGDIQQKQQRIPKNDDQREIVFKIRVNSCFNFTSFITKSVFKAIFGLLKSSITSKSLRIYDLILSHMEEFIEHTNRNNDDFFSVISEKYRHFHHHRRPK